MSKLLEVKDLGVSIDDREILKNVNLTIKPGEIHVLMGPNGAGKSTLANAIMAHPKYKITGGDIIFKGESVLEKTTDERARLGIFMSFQSPQEVPGITVEDFLRSAKAEHTGKNPSVLKFGKEVVRDLEDLEMADDYASRYLNVGFSGGEKKKTEILQMKVLNPEFIMLDETDSGLDVDAVRVVSREVSHFLDQDKSCMIITHISSILKSLKPDFVHVMMNGQIVKEGGPDLIPRIQKEGYGWIREELGLEPAEEEDGEILSEEMKEEDENGK